MHPGSGIHQAGFKRWPKENFAHLADRLISEYGTAIFLFGGPEERALAEEIESLMKNTPVIMAGQTTLSQTAALIKKYCLFVSNDSGPMHMAAALNVPVVALFGPTDAKATGPVSDKSVVISNKVQCAPCHRRKCNRDFSCMTKISVHEVMNNIDKMLTYV